MILHGSRDCSDRCFLAHTWHPPITLPKVNYRGSAKPWIVTKGCFVLPDQIRIVMEGGLANRNAQLAIKKLGPEDATIAKKMH